MIPKSTTAFICQECQASFPKWQGQCTSCGQWNTLVEEVTVSSSKSAASAKQPLNPSHFVSYSQAKNSSKPQKRFSSGYSEFDRVLGGGIVPGAVILMGGEPGIGKSTLLTQVVLHSVLSDKTLEKVEKNSKTNSVQGEGQSDQDQRPILYVAGEENPDQISLRINRILENEHIAKKAVSGSVHKKTIESQLVFFTSSDVDQLVEAINQKRPKLVIVDSIQAMTTQELTGAAGSVGQLREATDRITTTAKHHNIPVFLVGHVTKEGSIAGPKVLEHIVDSVLEISGERTGQLRLVRVIKNRFGATDEVGVFKMVSWGLEEVPNPAEFFLEHAQKSVPGSATICVMEGTRPLLLEVQALVVGSQLAMPRRVGRGIELSRIQVLAAVLQKHANLPLGSSDIFVSAAGGLKLKEASVDLGLAISIASSLNNKAVPENTVFIGEVGLLGEIRAVPYLEQRLKEAKRLGFKNVISRKTHQKVTDVIKELRLG